MMGWGQVPMPGMPFNQMITFPVNLTLRTTDEGIRMFGEPVDEIKGLHKKRHSFTGETIDGISVLPDVEGELFHITAEFEIGKAESFGVTVREFDIKYDAGTGQLICEGPENDIVPGLFSDPVAVHIATQLTVLLRSKLLWTGLLSRYLQMMAVTIYQWALTLWTRIPQ